MKNSDKNSLSKLEIEGKVEDDCSLVENQVLTFFRALFNGYHDRNLTNTGIPFVSDNTNLPKFLDNLEKLPDTDRDELKLEMSLDVLEYVVKHSANNKSPGLDGISYDL